MDRTESKCTDISLLGFWIGRLEPPYHGPYIYGHHDTDHDHDQYQTTSGFTKQLGLLRISL